MFTTNKLKMFLLGLAIFYVGRSHEKAPVIKAEDFIFLTGATA